MPDEDLTVGAFGDRTRELHAGLTSQGFEVSPAEQQRGFFGPATLEAVRALQQAKGLTATGVVDAPTLAALSAPAPAAATTVPSSTGGGEQPPSRAGGGGGGSGEGDSARVAGTIVLEHGSPASTVKVRLYQRGLGGSRTLLNEVETDQRGGYEIPYSAKGPANIEVYAVGPDGSEVQLSQTKFGAQAEERLDLIAPSAVQPPAGEFTRLKAAVAAYTDNRPELLKDAVEQEDRRDFSYLASTTGWDAGALALASEAFGNQTRTKIPADGLYAMARAGLPTDTRALAAVSKQTVAGALREAAAAGIIDPAAVDQSVQAFEQFAADYRFNNRIQGALSSPNDFIERATVSAADRAAFATVIRDEKTTDPWGRARAAGVSEAGIKNLQLQGKLAYLTFNNAELSDFLASRVSADPLELIELGYYDDAEWKQALLGLAGADLGRLAALIPPVFPGQTVDERLDTYTGELARRVRQMDPHAVTVHRIATGKMDGIIERDSVARFLQNATPLGFRLGKTPLGAFVAANEAAVWNGIAETRRDDTLNTMRTLSSLYAISPSDEAMSALLRAGFTSATDIAMHDYGAFVERLKLPLQPHRRAGEQEITQRIFWRAQQQSATVFNVFDGLKRLNAVPYAPGSTPEDAKKRDDQIVKTREKLAGLFPTLETLFGTVDYCECEQCQSVLSPAAYLVDLLHFIDPGNEAWATVKASYRARTGSDYTKQKPFDALNNRRPDLKNIALTCENTNVALPYIDIVNEVLEQLMMADGSPPVIEAYDVGEASSQDLIAEPQNILWSAYTGGNGKQGLRDLVYPLTLPFDLPLEMVRAFLKQLDLPLWRLRECLARPAALAPSATGRTDGWTDVWFERLGLGARDVACLTRSEDWHTLYGYKSLADALKIEATNSSIRPAETSLRNAKTLARRLDISYQELVELVRTRFINPHIENLIVLQRLGVDPTTVDRYLGEGNPLNDGERTELEADLHAQGLQASDLRPLRTEAIRKGTLVLRSPSVGCDFAKTTLEFDQDPADADQSMALALRKMNAFVRLQKRLGWETHELDRALMALMPGVASLTITTWPDAMRTALIYLAHVEELRERLEDRLSREELLILWSDIPTQGISCLYERLFLSPAVLGHDSVFSRRLGRVLQDKTVRLSDHVDAVRQALQVAPDDIEPVLVADARAHPQVPTIAPQAADRGLSIQNLSILMRYAALAKGLDLSVADLLTLLSLSEHKPLSPLDGGPLTDLAKDVPWNETLPFVRQVQLVSDADVDVAFVDRVCRHRGVAEEPAAEKDPVLIAVLALPPGDAAVPEKPELVLVQTLAAQLSAPEALVDYLLGAVLKDSAGKALKETGFSDPTRAAESLHRLRRALDLVQSLAITQAELAYLGRDPAALHPNDLPVAEVTDEAVAGSVLKGLTAWLELVVARKQLGRSERILAVLSGARQPVDATNTAAARQQQFLEALSALTGRMPPWLSPALEAVGATSGGGSIFEVTAFADPARLRKALESLRCLIRLGLNPKDVVQLASVAVDEMVAQKVRSSVKSRYTASAWRQLVKPIFDSLRKKQRDALVAHLTHVMDGDTPKYGDTTEKLFEYLLLDPGMEPVVVASRIQLAIASIQLFVQRCLMNLEQEHVDPQIIDVKRWEWMRRYRIWEVNRKMFIWPENWLDPEFRDDKTHLFRDLEGKLLQNDVNDDFVRSSFNSYLKGLEEIARLQMLTMYFEPGISPDGAVLHVVGRTPSAPHKYFYRRASHGTWTPWEPIDLGVEGEHLVLTAWRGRMHLFWVSFLEEAQASSKVPDTIKPGTDEVALGNLRGTTKVKLQLHWAEQVQAKWVNRSSTPAYVETVFDGLKATTDAHKRAFFVRAVLVGNGPGVEDDDLEIQVTAGTEAGTKAHKFIFFSKLAPPQSENAGTAPVASPFGGSGQATKWIAEGALQVRFVSAVSQSSETGTQLSDGGFHKVLGGGRAFSLLFPSNESLPIPARTPPSGVGRPTGFVFRPQNAQHVAYRSSDGSISDLFWTRNGWFYQSPSADADSSNPLDEPEPAVSDPHGYAMDDKGAICIAYAGTTKLHELVWSQLDPALDDPEHLATGWRIETLYQASSTAEQPQGRPLGGMFLPGRGVVFRTRDGRLRAVVAAQPGGPWQVRELNAGLPAAASDPTGLLMTKTQLGVTTVVSRHIFYLGADGDVHELRSDLGGQTWTHTNVTQPMTGVVKPAPGSGLAAYAFLGQNTLHVVYRGVDDRIHELWGFSGTWNYNPIGAPFTKAKGDPTGYVTESFGTQHVVYWGEGDQVVELWWSDAWRENILTRSVPAAPAPNSDVAGYSFESFRTQHVVYLAQDGSPRELWWSTDGWHTGAYELQNPFPDALGPLASPFFYEASGRDHTFFVEPYVVETAVHEWTEWIVTTREYVDVPLGKVTLTALNPKAVLIAPSEASLIKRAERFTNTVFDERAIVRTAKGVLNPKLQVEPGALRVSPSLADKASTTVVDVRPGWEPELQRIALGRGGLR